MDESATSSNPNTANPNTINLTDEYHVDPFTGVLNNSMNATIDPLV